MCAVKGTQLALFVATIVAALSRDLVGKGYVKMLFCWVLGEWFFSYKILCCAYGLDSPVWSDLEMRHPESD